MDFSLCFDMMGGLCLFLFGMYIMGSGLESFCGGAFQSVVSKITQSKFKALLFGAVITAIIQSSSATTVIIVGLVNSGVMSLSQSVGVIIGANIGTTITSWILSLTGIEGNSIFISLLKPTYIFTVLAVVGIMLIMFSDKQKNHNIGFVFLGFFLIITGMNTMNVSVAPLADTPEFTQLFIMFDNPAIAIILGAVLTAVLQSSSATVGILQSLSLTGAITCGRAIPLILGQNIGTCITSLISSVGADKNGRCAALFHLFFNLFGVVITGGVFYGLNYFLKFDFLDKSINTVGIALVHTLFNTLSAVFVFPFTDKLEKISQLSFIKKVNNKPPEGKTI